tara:strand:- start:32065 stop:33084 length:1020 start_codon:yes stop_codon:yes gene_type:complete
MKKILVTGGLGYIGSHTVVELINSGYEPIIYDNLSNSKKIVLKRLEDITKRKIKCIIGDIRDKVNLKKTFKEESITAVLHFAGLKSVSESNTKPYEYYDNNLNGTLILVNEMISSGIKHLIFSSSATVYGVPESCPINEKFQTSATNPYGRSKLMVEQCLRDIYNSEKRINISLLRYFNPIGAHESGLIGESPNEVPNNLMPYISQVGVGRLKELSVFGNDYPTKDGTCIRDYIHVVDLARGHISALSYMFKNEKNKIETFNLGTGKGYTVLEMIKEFEKTSKLKIPYKITERRKGDVSECWADPKKSELLLNWKAEFKLETMMRDLWNWQKKNPNGYE